MSHNPKANALVRALDPIVSRVRRDVSARKGAHGGSFWTNEPLTDDAIAHHLNGGPARGACPIKPGEQLTALGLLDLDSHRGEVPWPEMVKVAKTIMAALERLGYRPIAFRSSGGRGIHIFVLFERPQDAYSVRAMLVDLLAEHGYANGAKGVKHNQIEVFPKQDAVGVGEFGNQFILPLAGKSEPLDALFDLEPMGKEWALQMDWPVSPDVPVLQRPVPKAAKDGGRAPDDLDRVRGALFAIDNSDEATRPGYERWFELMCAVHDATGGSEDGMELFRDWSAQAAVHDEREFRKVWRGIKPAGARLGAGTQRDTLYKLAMEAGWDKQTPATADGFEDVGSEVWPLVAREPTSSWSPKQSPAPADDYDLFGEVPSTSSAPAEAAPWDDAQDIAYTDMGNPISAAAPHQDPGLAAQIAEDHRIAQQALDERHAAKVRWQKAVHEAPDERSLIEQVCRSITLDALLDEIGREQLAVAVQSRMQGFGAKLPIAACRKLVAPVKRERAAEAPSWVEGWVYVTDQDQFYRQDSDEFLSMQGFNARFNRHLPPQDDGYRKNASWVALEDLQIPTVTRAVYLPKAGPLFELNGVRCVNRYRPSSTPRASDKLTAKDSEVITLLLNHLSKLCNGRQEIVEILVNWMAFCVQNPGVKIRWSPLIKGTQGDGKTLLGDLLSAVMGSPNVKVIGPKVLGTDFSDWAHGACVGVLEEMRLTGHSRHDIYNALKPNITNSSIEIHPKGSAAFNTVNTMNYMAYTNYSDALPLDDGDRRWMIIFSPFHNESDLRCAFGEVGAYFDALFSGIETQFAGLRRWLLDWPIADSFKPNGRAPMTDEKKSMVAMNQGDDEEAVRSALEAGGQGIGTQVVVTSMLKAAAQNINPEIMLNTSALAKVLGKLGWVKVPGQLKWRGAVCRLWTKRSGAVSNEVLRAELDETVKTGYPTDSVPEDFDLFS